MFTLFNVNYRRELKAKKRIFVANSDLMICVECCCGLQMTLYTYDLIDINSIVGRTRVPTIICITLYINT